MIILLLLLLLLLFDKQACLDLFKYLIIFLGECNFSSHTNQDVTGRNLMGVVLRFWQDILNLESYRYHEVGALETTSLELILLRTKNKWNVKLVQFRNISYNLEILEHDL